MSKKPCQMDLTLNIDGPLFCNNQRLTHIILELQLTLKVNTVRALISPSALISFRGS